PHCLPTCGAPPRSAPFPYTTLFRSQICSGRSCQHVLDLYPPPRIKQPLQLCPVLPDERSELFQRHNIIFCFQAPLYKLFRCASEDRKSTRLNSSHVSISYAVFCLKK